jgi:hypothetical protein
LYRHKHCRPQKVELDLACRDSTTTKWLIERFRELRTNCCVRALSEWLYMLNIALTGILIQNIVKQML